MTKHKNTSYMSCGSVGVYMDAEGHERTSVERLLNALHRLFHK